MTTTEQRQIAKPIPEWLHPTLPRAGGYEFRSEDLMLYFTRLARSSSISPCS